MYKKILLVVVLFSSLLASAQVNQKDAKGLKQGNWEGRFNNGDLRYTGKFLNDKEQGTFVYYYKNSGKKKAENIFVEGLKKVETKAFHENGKQMWTGQYVDQERDGEWNFYDKKGVLVSIENYSNGKKHGTSKYYFVSGKISEEINYVNDREDGAYTQYYENGYARTKGNSENGTFHGLTTLFYNDGTKMLEGKYENGIKHGAWREYHRGGVIKLQVKYERGKTVLTKRENGDFIDYYPNGIPSEEVTYVNGKKDGSFKIYYDKGTWETETLPATQPGMPLEMKQKLVDRQTETEGEYMEGKYEGDIYFYTESGAILKIETYDNGLLISTRNEE